MLDGAASEPFAVTVEDTVWDWTETTAAGHRDATARRTRKERARSAQATESGDSYFSRLRQTPLLSAE